MQQPTADSSRKKKRRRRNWLLLSTRSAAQGEGQGEGQCCCSQSQSQGHKLMIMSPLLVLALLILAAPPLAFAASPRRMARIQSHLDRINKPAVRSIRVVYDRMTGRSRGFGFVTMSSAEEAGAAVEQFNSYADH
ncbi:hypothetical protein SEVIR_7G330901v4 [Setaria viridis]|uniref:RRM domain-containing protein n=1 Tax=Setaria viridis TaxID=4556 RepID=A0A4U6TXS4_SETVI|nr:hypothetical protein SEVIR_7G330901v2 [Setaria viridis]TKW07800.1 hypothetical protein SEVIR_7G330901v2 [Setaria viridis]